FHEQEQVIRVCDLRRGRLCGVKRGFEGVRWDGHLVKSACSGAYTQKDDAIRFRLRGLHGHGAGEVARKLKAAALGLLGDPVSVSHQFSLQGLRGMPRNGAGAGVTTSQLNGIRSDPVDPVAAASDSRTSPMRR